MMMKEKGLFTFSLLLFTFSAAFGSTQVEQGISLDQGWNSIHIQVAETNDVDTLFKDWPVEWVALYDPAAFLETRQYSAESSNEGTFRTGYRMWRRSEPGLSQFHYVPADSVLVCYANGPHVCTFRGEPCAPRITWHKSDVDENLNLVGFSTSGETTTLRYFSGLNVGDAVFYQFAGPDDGKPMVFPVMIAGEMTFKNGQVLAVSSSKVSDWSGVLNVSPRNGPDFGAEGTMATLEVRNDGEEARVVQVKFDNDKLPSLDGCLCARDALAALTNGAWTAFSMGAAPLEKTLEAGETWKIQLALDRQKLEFPAGTVQGSIIEIRDVSPNGSAMLVRVPVKATCDDAAKANAWPKGVWLASAELDSVSFFLTKVGDSTGKPNEEGMKAAGGRMKVRLPLYVDEKGAVTLLQRFWYGRDTNGVLRCFSGAVKESVDPLTDVKRVSSASLPADQPVLGTTANGVFGQEPAKFAFTVGETSNVNPMRHAPHPQHDGLKADYSGPTPSGDSFMNYAQTVKPEAFSVTNLVELTWEKTSAAAWNPEETLTGDLKWEFHGIRHERPIQAQGRFVMKRLSPVSMKME